MGVIKDGVKLAFGFWLFFKLLGLAGCLATIGVITCLAANADKAKERSSARREPAPSGHRSVSIGLPAGRSSYPGHPVSYPRGCNVRADPKGSAAKVGFATAGKPYSVQMRQGQWRKITLDDGTKGWTACAVDMRLASHPAAGGGE
jgi:hypothetical protein